MAMRDGSRKNVRTCAAASDWLSCLVCHAALDALASFSRKIVVALVESELSPDRMRARGSGMIDGLCVLS